MEENTSNFIHDFIDEDLAAGVYDRVQTRFPPEPNGYLHIGHAKAIQINFTTAKKYGGVCNLRLDDTNPSKEDMEYVDAIKEDIQWLGFRWNDVYYASGYFDFIHDCAIRLIELGKAYVDDSTADEIRESRGTLTEPGKESPYRERSIEENLDLFCRMTAGEFPDGARVLRAKIDMQSPNMNMRDPVIYRIAHITHHQTGDKWCVYPLYDFAHPLSDYKEGVTHSLCSLEFENHRPLYDWFLRALDLPQPPRQIEFARLNLNYCLTSKRKCLQLVNEGIVDGWDDPRMATICGMRRRGCMAVLRPLRVVIDNYPDGKTEEIELPVNQDKPEMGTRKTTFSKELFVEQEDFMKEPPKKYFRLFPGNEVRLRGAYFVKCVGFDEDETGAVTCVHCTYDPESRGGNSPDGRKVKGTLHWVSAQDSIPFTAKLYDRLFNAENPSDESKGSFKDNLNPDSLVVLEGCRLEGGLSGLKPGDTFQFMRQGYFCVDTTSTPEKTVFNRTVQLNSSWK